MMSAVEVKDNILQYIRTLISPMAAVAARINMELSFFGQNQ